MPKLTGNGYLSKPFAIQVVPAIKTLLPARRYRQKSLQTAKSFDVDFRAGCLLGEGYAE